MSTFKLVVAVFISVFFGVLSALGISDYSQHHLMLKVRLVKNDQGESTGHFDTYAVHSPLFNSRDYVYMFPVYQEKDNKGWWQQHGGIDSEVKEGPQLFGNIKGDENSRKQYVVICTDREMTSYEEAQNESWNPYWGNSYYFDPSEGLPDSIILECP